MISSLHLATTLIFDVSWWWSLYLNRCVAELASESLDAPGCHTPLSIEPILAEPEGIRYMGPILPASLVELFHKNGGGGDGGATAEKRKSSTTGGKRGCGCATMRTCLHYPLGTGRTRVIYWQRRYSRPYTVQFCARTGTCVGCAGRTASGNTCTSLPPLPPELATTVAGRLKADRGEWRACLQPSDGRPSSPQKPQSDPALTNQGQCS